MPPLQIQLGPLRAAPIPKTIADTSFQLLLIVVGIYELGWVLVLECYILF